MAHQVCNYCGLAYTDGDIPHSYDLCVERLDEQIDALIDQMTTLNKRRRDARTLVDEGRSR